jgi:lysozyme
MSTIGPDGEAIIKYFEGCKLTAYPDPATGGDPWTIGWGTTGKDVHEGLMWTQAQCDARFHKDIGDFAVGVAKLLGKTTTGQHQFDALCSFAYNLGLGNLKSSTLLKKHVAGLYPDAAKEFVKWNKANSKVMAGLTKRRNAEAALYATPDDKKAPKL